MELVANNQPLRMIQHENEIVSNHSSFIEANTEKVMLGHLKNECIIPVFSKDNESTISHFQFIDRTLDIAKSLFPHQQIAEPEIRVSHIVKGRTPSAIGKPAKELLEHEKTIYYERCAFLIEVPTITQIVNNNLLTLSIGGVRSYSQENLYSKKTLEKFKVFVGFNNKVCANLCVSTDGFSNDIRIGSIMDMEEQINTLVSSYNREKHIQTMTETARYSLTEMQFAHLIGKLRMYTAAPKFQNDLPLSISLTDSQITSVVRQYYDCPNFKRDGDGSINLWNLYNLFTEANKSSYIDNNIERNVNAYELINNLGNSFENKSYNWLLPQ
ncbi:DUF3871 family protein [Winogradskyella sediminis]|uniref:DUF3871 family protein n=1 Tax=Winogradskyella sediminis TaxID=1382466 RepID=UPI003AA9C170